MPLNLPALDDDDKRYSANRTTSFRESFHRSAPNRLTKVHSNDFWRTWWSSTNILSALVIILVLNLLFWLIVIIWRFCYLRKLNAVVERRRAEMRGRINDGLDSEQRGPEDDIYALSRGDFPPSYDDAIKSHPIFPPEPTSFPSPQPPSTALLPGDASVRPRTSVDASVANVTSSTTEAVSGLSEAKVERIVEVAENQAANEGPSTRIHINTQATPPPLPKSPPPIE